MQSQTRNSELIYQLLLGNGGDSEKLTRNNLEVLFLQYEVYGNIHMKINEKFT